MKEIVTHTSFVREKEAQHRHEGGGKRQINWSPPRKN